MRTLYVVIMVFTLIGCSNYSEEFTKSGEITEIEEDMIYVDDSPIRVEDSFNFEVGDRVKVTLIDKSGEDDWDPNDFKVKKIELIK